MWKRVMVLSLILALILGISAQAVQIRAVQLQPTLSFSGTKATCKTVVVADNDADRISITVRLWDGAKIHSQWSTSGRGSINFRQTATVTRGKTYKLTVNATINGVAQPQQSITRTCP